MTVLPTGEVLLFSGSWEGGWLDAFDVDLGVLWSRDAGKHAIGLTEDERGTPWVIDRGGASAFNRRGEVDLRREAPALDGMEVSSLAFVNDDLVFAYQHLPDSPPCAPALVCLTGDNTIRWSTRLETTAVAFGGRPRMAGDRFDQVGRFIAANWVCGYLEAGELTVSGDTVMAVYSDMPQTGVAIGYAASLTDGTLRYTTNLGPIEKVASLGSDRFLVGYQGYGAFHTVLYDEKGQEQNQVRLPMPLNADGVFHTRVPAGRDGLFSTCSTNLSPKRGSSDHLPGQVSTLVRLGL